MQTTKQELIDALLKVCSETNRNGETEAMLADMRQLLMRNCTNKQVLDVEKTFNNLPRVNDAPNYPGRKTEGASKPMRIVEPRKEGLPKKMEAAKVAEPAQEKEKAATQPTQEKIAVATAEKKNQTIDEDLMDLYNVGLEAAKQAYPDLKVFKDLLKTLNVSTKGKTHDELWANVESEYKIISGTAQDDNDTAGTDGQ